MSAMTHDSPPQQDLPRRKSLEEELIKSRETIISLKRELKDAWAIVFENANQQFEELQRLKREYDASREFVMLDLKEGPEIQSLIQEQQEEISSLTQINETLREEMKEQSQKIFRLEVEICDAKSPRPSTELARVVELEEQLRDAHCEIQRLTPLRDSERTEGAKKQIAALHAEIRALEERLRWERLRTDATKNREEHRLAECQLLSAALIALRNSSSGKAGLQANDPAGETLRSQVRDLTARLEKAIASQEQVEAENASLTATVEAQRKQISILTTANSEIKSELVALRQTKEGATSQSLQDIDMQEVEETLLAQQQQIEALELELERTRAEAYEDIQAQAEEIDRLDRLLQAERSAHPREVTDWNGIGIVEE